MSKVDDIVLCAMNNPRAVEHLKRAAASIAGHPGYSAMCYEQAAISGANLAGNATPLDILRAAVKLAETCDAAWLAENTNNEGA